jgi:hypothetical protein
MIHDPNSARAPSPAPTEVEDPDPESILTHLQTLNIKVRDFAYEPPYTSPSPSSSTPPQSIPAPAQVPEIFDQYKGIAEFEYRLAQSPRTLPIFGKTMRRLLDLEWVLYEEAEERLHAMDWEALREHDKKEKKHKPYPWRPCIWNEVPDAEARKRCLEEHGSWFVNYDRIMRNLDWIEERDEKERKQIEMVQEAVRQWEMKEEERMRMVVDPAPASPTSSFGSPSRKRALDDEGESSASTSTSDDPNTKRPRLSQSQPSSQSQSQPHPPAPPKQYPAPLFSYDPVLYPDAKNAIELSAQSQPRPVVPPRADTPPAEEREEEEERRPGALVRRPKRLRRTLSRTQTFTQL